MARVSFRERELVIFDGTGSSIYSTQIPHL
jgi:hypothetical protein